MSDLPPLLLHPSVTEKKIRSIVWSLLPLLAYSLALFLVLLLYLCILQRKKVGIRETEEKRERERGKEKKDVRV